MPRGNTTVQEQEARRQKVRECWARGLRSIKKIAEEIGCAQQTVKRDLVILRRQVNCHPITEQKINLIKEQIAAGYEKDIEELDGLIKMAIADTGEENETEESQTPAKESDNKNINSDSKSTFIKTKKKTKGRDYNAIAILMQRKLEARRKLAELYQILEPENKKISVSASATAHAASSASVKIKPEEVTDEHKRRLEDNIAILQRNGILSAKPGQN